jgi:hypothetical protein
MNVASPKYTVSNTVVTQEQCTTFAYRALWVMAFTASVGSGATSVVISANLRETDQ